MVVVTMARWGHNMTTCNLGHIVYADIIDYDL